MSNDHKVENGKTYLCKRMELAAGRACFHIMILSSGDSFEKQVNVLSSMFVLGMCFSVPTPTTLRDLETEVTATLATCSCFEPFFLWLVGESENSK